MTPYILVVTLAALITLAISILSHRLLKGLLPSFLSGLAGLFVMQSSLFWGVPPLSANIFTLVVSACMGLPGVISLLFLRVVSLT